VILTNSYLEPDMTVEEILECLVGDGMADVAGAVRGDEEALSAGSLDAMIPFIRMHAIALGYATLALDTENGDEAWYFVAARA